LQRDLSLDGSADEIYKRASEIIIKDMIPYLIENNVEGKPQSGEVIRFHRFAPVDLKDIDSLDKIHDCIRMSDAPFYDKAFINTDNFRIEFFDSHLVDGCIECKCKIYKSKGD